jgi:prepilin-type N-terminal cleavage/methylation domain-containing protein
MKKEGFTLIEVLISLLIVGSAAYAISTQYANLDRMVSESDISLQARNLISQKISALNNGEESYPDVRSSDSTYPLTYLANEVNKSIQPILMDLGNEESRLRSLAVVGTGDRTGRVCPEVRGFEMHMTYLVNPLDTAANKRIRIHVIPMYMKGAREGSARTVVQAFEDMTSVQDVL